MTKKSIFIIVLFLLLQISIFANTNGRMWPEWFWGSEELIIQEDGILIINQTNDYYNGLSDINTFAYIKNNPSIVYVDAFGLEYTGVNINKIEDGITIIVDNDIKINVKKGDVAVIFPEAYKDARSGKELYPILNISLNGKLIKENYELKPVRPLQFPPELENIKTQYWKAENRTEFLYNVRRNAENKLKNIELSKELPIEKDFFIILPADNFSIITLNPDWKDMKVPPSTTLHLTFEEKTVSNYDGLAEFIKFFKFKRVIIGEGYNNADIKDIGLIAKNIAYQLKAVQDAEIPVYISLNIQQDGSDIQLLEELQKAGVKASGLWIGGLHWKGANFPLPFRRYKKFGYKNYVVGQYLDKLDEGILKQLKELGYIGICQIKL